ncbi:unnamed protein product, partial [Closterium sp. Naga37s-1]
LERGGAGEDGEARRGRDGDKRGGERRGYRGVLGEAAGGGVRRAGERVGKERAVRGGRRRAGGRGKNGGISNSRGLQERRRKRGGRRGGVGGGKEGGRVRDCEGVMVGEWPGVDGLAAVGALMAVRGRRVREGRGGERGRAGSKSGGGGAGVGGQSSNSSGVPSLHHPPSYPSLPPQPVNISPILSAPVQCSCAVVGPHLSHAPSAPHFGAAIDSHSLVLRKGQRTPPTRLQAYVNTPEVGGNGRRSLLFKGKWKEEPPFQGEMEGGASFSRGNGRRSLLFKGKWKEEPPFQGEMEGGASFSRGNGRRSLLFKGKWKEEPPFQGEMEGGASFSRGNGRRSLLFKGKWKEEPPFQGEMEGGASFSRITTPSCSLPTPPYLSLPPPTLAVDSTCGWRWEGGTKGGSNPLILTRKLPRALSLPPLISPSFPHFLLPHQPGQSSISWEVALMCGWSLGSRTDVWIEVGGRGGGGLHGTHEVGGGGGGGGTGRGLTKGVGGGGGRGVGRGVGRRRLLGLKGRSVAYLRADSSGLLASPVWLPALQQLGVSKGHAGRQRGDSGPLPSPGTNGRARRLFNAFAHRFRCAIGAPMPAAHHATSGAASSATAASVARTGEAAAAGATRAAGAAGAAGTVGEAAIPIPMPRMPPHWPVLYLLLHACDKLTLFGLIRNASVHVLQSPMHVPSVPSELYRRPSLLVLEFIASVPSFPSPIPFSQPHAHALCALRAASPPIPAGARVAAACTGTHQPAQLLRGHRRPLLPPAPAAAWGREWGWKGEVASGAGGFDAGMAGGSVAGDGGGMEDYDEDEVDGRGKTGKVVGGQGAVEGAGWGDEYGDEGEEVGEEGEGEGGGEGMGGGEDDYEYDDDYYGAPIEELMSDLEHANAAPCPRGAAAKSAASLAADRGEAVQAVSDALKRFVRGKWDTGALAGAAGIGGSGGTAIIAPALRGLPVGVPKIIVSTVASGNTAPYVGTSELLLLPSVADVAGLNAILPPTPLPLPPFPNTTQPAATQHHTWAPRISYYYHQWRTWRGLNAILRAALSSAAAALAGMLLLRALPTQPPSTALPSSVGASAAATAPVTVGITMFGVTTPCVTEVQRLLSSKASKEGGAGWVGDAGGVGEVETVVFHATGTGGRAMEENVASGLIQVRSLHIPLFTRPLIPPHHAAHPLTALLTSTRAASYQHSEIRIDLPRSFHSKLTLPSPLYQPVLHITTTEVKDLVVGGTMACLQFTVLTVTSATPLPPHPVLDVTTTEAADFVAVLDITTTEVADFIVGGTMPCLPTRFDAAIQHKVPLVLSLGALDMVNFGEASSVPKEFDGRTLHVHNPQVTLMRTTADENRRIAQFIADKMNQSQAPVTLLIPEGGLSALDAPGMAFWDPAADAALFDELEKQVEQTDSRKVGTKW